MEKTAEDKAASPISILGILLFLVILNWNLYSSFRSILQIFINLLHHAWKVCVEGKATCPEAQIQKLCSDENLEDEKTAEGMITNGTDSTPKLFPCENVDDNKLSIVEVKMVMEKLGTVCDPGDDNFEETLGSDEIAGLFEEEPSPEEVKEAFDLFDENNDGFIDAGELGKVLSKLGLVEPLEVECQRMIRVFDDNGDGRIDFKEFVKLLEHSFC